MYYSSQYDKLKSNVSVPIQVHKFLATQESIMYICMYVVVITPFGVLLLIYKADAPRARKRPRVRPCKPQQHDKRCDNDSC